MPPRKPAKLEDRVPAYTADSLVKQFKDVLDEEMHHERTRKRVQEIIGEYVDTVSFAKKVKEYAGEEFDVRTFRSIKYWLLTIGTTILTSLVAYLIGRNLPR
jgi:hypothetical protein